MQESWNFQALLSNLDFDALTFQFQDIEFRSIKIMWSTSRVDVRQYEAKGRHSRPICRTWGGRELGSKRIICATQHHQEGSMALTRPPYFDPNTGKMYETSCGNTEGWLTKQSEWLKDWRRRYFILKGIMKPASVSLLLFITTNSFCRSYSHYSNQHAHCSYIADKAVNVLVSYLP